MILMDLDCLLFFNSIILIGSPTPPYCSKLKFKGDLRGVLCQDRYKYLLTRVLPLSPAQHSQDKT